MGGKVGESPAALRAAVFSLSSKNLRGGGVQTPPPAGRGLILWAPFAKSGPSFWCGPPPPGAKS